MDDTENPEPWPTRLIPSPSTPWTVKNTVMTRKQATFWASHPGHSFTSPATLNQWSLCRCSSSGLTSDMSPCLHSPQPVTGGHRVRSCLILHTHRNRPFGPESVFLELLQPPCPLPTAASAFTVLGWGKVMSLCEMSVPAPVFLQRLSHAAKHTFS